MGRLIFDMAATAKKCWPEREFVPLGPCLPEPWLAAILGETGWAESGPVVWNGATDESYWDHCLVVERAADSQYDRLRCLDQEVASGMGNLACLALSGDNFHGQKGRPWQTLSGNFHLSLKVDLDLSAATCSRPLVMLPAVVALDVLAALGGLLPAVGIKWVNDILIAGGKVAGVLTAARSTSGRLTSAVFGVGLNLNVAPESVVSPLNRGVTSVRRHLGQQTPDIGSLLDLFLSGFAARLTEIQLRGPSPVIKEYRRHSLVLGQVVGIWPEGQKDPVAGQPPLHQGKVLEILPDLSLRLEGVPQPISEGRLGFPPIY